MVDHTLPTAPRAIIFDLDGTLVDSLEDIARALDAALADHDLPAPGRTAIRAWIGGGARSLVECAVEAAYVDSVLARFRVHYAAAPVVFTRLYAGLPAALDSLVAAGRTLAVLSNKPHELTVQIAAQVLAPWPFRVIAGARIGVPLKPAPDAALAIAAELGMSPHECAFVGDSEIDIMTAHAAGMIPVAVTWGFRPRAELVAAAPARIIDLPEDLEALGR